MMTHSDYIRGCALLRIEPLDLPPHSRALPSWLTPAFASTPAAQHKLQAWAESHDPDLWEREADPATLLPKLHAIGDVVWAHVIARTLAVIPAPVRDYLMERVTWVGVGLAYAGFICPPIEFAERPWLIVLSPSRGTDDRALASIIVHEGAHAWLLREPVGVKVRSAFADETMLDVPIAQLPPRFHDLVTRARANNKRDEREAETLESEWLKRFVPRE